MSEIMGLRTLILDNVQILHPHYKRDTPISLACSTHEDLHPWCATLKVTAHAAIRGSCDQSFLGTGETPEAAYRDLLKTTAMELFNRVN